ncbi:MAG: extracellular solute-binding protein [Pseudomonadota bacterium]
MIQIRRLFASSALFGALTLTACAPAPSENAANDELNLYTARHYASDDAVYAAFTEATGIEVNVVEASGDLLIERIRADGARSPADVIITVDAGRLHRAAEAGLFQPVGDLGGALGSVPANLRHPDGLWFGFSTRARVMVYAPDRIDAAQISTYEDLADEALRGRICVRSSNNVYNISLLAALIERVGAEAAEAWAAGVVANLARPPQGGDTDQIRAVAAGECDVALVNHYYLGRLANTGAEADLAVFEAVDLVFPNQNAGGAHVNISGAGLAAGAPNREAAEAFLAFLLSETGQRAFPELTNEYPALDIAYHNPALEGFGTFEGDPLNVSALGERAAEAQRIFDRVGWP